MVRRAPVDRLDGHRAARPRAPATLPATLRTAARALAAARAHRATAGTRLAIVDRLRELALVALAGFAVRAHPRGKCRRALGLSDRVAQDRVAQTFAYQQGATNVFTAAFDVYVNRRGVCRDFTNLFICLARLLGVPARYVCGYIYTGPKSTELLPHQCQGEASHAWVQLYLPQVGWKGFDPTNGILTQTDHVRVAVGRNYLDATPTSGTIFVVGGGETLAVAVSVEPHG